MLTDEDDDFEKAEPKSTIVRKKPSKLNLKNSLKEIARTTVEDTAIGIKPETSTRKRKRVVLGAVSCAKSKCDTPQGRKKSICRAIISYGEGSAKEATSSGNRKKRIGVSTTKDRKRAKTSQIIHKKKENMKKARTYTRYIQKKFSPSIFSEVIDNLSLPQIEWVKSSGFGSLLEFKMQCYPHTLGYNVVEAFNGSECSLMLKSGSVKITEEIVHRTLGFPMGREVVEFNGDDEVYGHWGKQFPGRLSFLISPIMVRDVMRKKSEVDAEFKWNFMILLYNFFIESNQNAWLLRDVLRFSGDVERCSEYNWCRLLLQKLISTHAYWAKLPKRNFTGALPLLIYVYVDQVKNNRSNNVQRTIPAYLAWSDTLLRDRQNYDEKHNCFGVGEIQYNYEITEVQDERHDGEIQGMADSKGGTIASDTDKGIKQTDIVETQKEDKTSGTELVNNTQAGVDALIDKHFDEPNFISGFERNIKLLDDIYKRCLTDYESALALYPQNAKVEELKNKYAVLFKVFDEVSPISKKLGSRKVVDGVVRTILEPEEAQYMPNYSLGLSQFEAENLDLHLEGRTKSYMEDDNRVLGSFANESSAETGYAGRDKGKRLVEYNAGETFVGKTPSMGCISRDKGKKIVEYNGGGVIVKQRPSRETRATQTLRSPFVSRVVDIKPRTLTTEEKKIWAWLFQNKRKQKENLFGWNGRMCTRADFQSMKENNKVESNVIDTWTILLNENEILRSDSSPLRLFLTSETTCGPLKIQSVDDEADAKLRRYALFDDCMDLVIKMVNDIHNKRYTAKDFDMFVFPVYYLEHHYVICYNMKQPRCEILDNRVAKEGIGGAYGTLPKRLHDCFCQWMSIYNLPKEREIVNLKPIVVRKKWQTTSNLVDSGIFAMRHMETYMGNAYKWNCGLPMESVYQKMLINKLRIIYCYQMLTWPANRKKQVIVNEAEHFAQGKT